MTGHALASMTGFGQATAEAEGWQLGWELRSVNGRGLDLKFRLPPGFERIESVVRAEAGRWLKRGNVQAALTCRRETATAVTIDRAALEQVLAAALALQARIGAPPPRAEALLALPGVMRRDGAAEEATPSETVLAAAQTAFGTAVAALAESRRQEGARLAAIVGAIVDEIDGLRRSAETEAAAQPELALARLRASLARLTEAAPVSEERLAQEVALLASRADVREELDRLASHVAAARALLAQDAPSGRQLDFLVQEFLRETNTLCSKSASTALTAIGLSLKAAVEQLREQVQNIE